MAETDNALRGVGTGGNAEAALWPSGNKRQHLLDLDAPEAVAELAAALEQAIEHWLDAGAVNRFDSVEGARAILAALRAGRAAGVTSEGDIEMLSPIDTRKPLAAAPEEDAESMDPAAIWNTGGEG